MKPEMVPPHNEEAFVKQGNASKPVSFHPSKTEAVLAALLKVKPPAKSDK
jgi:hypothetical protein